MERKDHDDAVYFVGPEVETTPASGMKTLFVVGVRSVSQILTLAKTHNCRHIYLGANRSFQKNKIWNIIIPELIDNGFRVTLDYPVSSHQFILNTLDKSVSSHPYFIPLISCIIPEIETFNKNFTIKIDDVDFEGKNSGVWCIPSHALLDSNRYTEWKEYANDHIIMRDSDIWEARKPVKKI